MAAIKTRYNPEESPDERQTPTAETQVQAWEQLEAGRYMPRRIRGSYRGRDLG
jgi:hypothetical protein